MSTPFSVDGKLNLPGTPGLPADALPFALSNQYDSKAEYEYNLPGSSGTKSVDFGTMPTEGAKLVLVVYEPSTSAPPIELTVNGGDEPIELTAGGFFALGSPSPQGGVTSLSIAHTGAGRVRVWLLG